MKKIIAIIALSIMLLPLSASAKKNNANVASSSSPSISPSAAKDINSSHKDWRASYEAAKNAQDSQKVDKLKELGITLIDNRVNLLQNIRTRTENTASLSNDDKQAILDDISKTIEDLAALKTRIQSETQVASLKNDIREIFDTHRVYMVAGPRDLGETLVNHGNYILGRLQAIQVKLQVMLEAQKNSGTESSSVEQLMKEANNKLIDAQSQLNIAEEKFKSMTPANTSAAKTARTEGKAAMKRAKDDLKSAHDLLKQITAALKDVSSPSPTLSASPDVSPAVLSPSPTVSASN